MSFGMIEESLGVEARHRPKAASVMLMQSIIVGRRPKEGYLWESAETKRPTEIDFFLRKKGKNSLPISPSPTATEYKAGR